ncbi:hypothetical protein, partial [Thiolapillus sp.]|uniref:hypothetical protein n=1 Tax=Thiolapillus sp. TaxID=2017437 RepID=UPI003AF5DFAD
MKQPWPDSQDKVLAEAGHAIRNGPHGFFCYYYILSSFVNSPGRLPVLTGSAYQQIEQHKIQHQQQCGSTFP